MDGSARVVRWPQTAGDGVVKVVRSVPDGASILVGHDFPESALGSSHLVLEPDRFLADLDERAPDLDNVAGRI